MGTLLVHLDPLGGMAGDMFIAALLDARPDLQDGMMRAIKNSGLPKNVNLELKPHVDWGITGKHFRVIEPDHAHHHHTRYVEIRSLLESSLLDSCVKEKALQIFAFIAKVEAEIHGKTIETISFHEVGEWDSIADIVGAAFLINELDAEWSVGHLPLGGGVVQTAHGPLPVPAPATAKLLEGFNFIDDGVGGERVTPTGAAILKFLCAKQGTAQAVGTLNQTGVGFGSRKLADRANIVRAMFFDQSESKISDDVICQINFDVDDQTPEDLAIALAHIREHPSVLDVLQSVSFGKKGRVSLSVQILAIPDDANSVFEMCFSETTTIGIRHQLVPRVKLERDSKILEINSAVIELKRVVRPNGQSAKVESDSLKQVRGYLNRERIRAEAISKKSS